MGGFATRVFKEAGPYRKLRELARVLTMVVRDVVRVQNRINSLMRSRGVTRRSPSRAPARDPRRMPLSAEIGERSPAATRLRRSQILSLRRMNEAASTTPSEPSGRKYPPLLTGQADKMTVK